MDLAAWGIIGDMGSMLELENRYIVKEGLKNINNKLLWALMEKQAYSITGAMSPSKQQLIDAMNPISVAFYIVPLVNAMIRVGTMEEKKRDIIVEQTYYVTKDGKEFLKKEDAVIYENLLLQKFSLCMVRTSLSRPVAWMDATARKSFA